MGHLKPAVKGSVTASFRPRALKLVIIESCESERRHTRRRMKQEGGGHKTHQSTSVPNDMIPLCSNPHEGIYEVQIINAVFLCLF